MQGILSHAQAYASRNCLVRLLTAGSDSTQLDALAAEVAAAGEDLMQLLALDSNARLQGMEAAVVEARDLLRSAVHFKVRRTTPITRNNVFCYYYAPQPDSVTPERLCTLLTCVQDPSADARAEVERLGGIEAVLADPTKLGTVLQHLDVTARVTIQAVGYTKGIPRQWTLPTYTCH